MCNFCNNMQMLLQFCVSSWLMKCRTSRERAFIWYKLWYLSMITWMQHSKMFMWCFFVVKVMENINVKTQWRNVEWQVRTLDILAVFRWWFDKFLKWQRSVLNENLLLVLHHVTRWNELEWIHAEKQVVVQFAFMEDFLDGLMKWDFVWAWT